MTETYKVFVYGTLREGECNHHFLQQAKKLYGTCWTRGRLFDIGHGYPALVYGGAGQVWGELYEVSAEELVQLDMLEDYKGEGEDNLYSRITGQVYCGNEWIEALLYVFLEDQIQDEPEILNGDWCLYRRL